MRLSIYKRQRVVSLYYEHNLNFKKENRFEVLQELALKETIEVSQVTLRKIIAKYEVHCKNMFKRFLNKFL